MVKSRIIFKLDDYCGPSKHVRKLDRFIRMFKIKVTWGIIGISVEKWSNKDIEWTKSAFRSGLYHFWNHGWTHDLGEFKELSATEALDHILRTQSLVKKRLGITMHVFGAPCNAISMSTTRALERCNEIDNWYYGDQSFSRTVFKREVELEYPLGSPRLIPFVKNFRIKRRSDKTFVLQGHPNAWKFIDFLNFYCICFYLKICKSTFVFPA